MDVRALLTAITAGFLLVGVTGTGCSGPLRPPDACPALACDPNCGTAGQKLDTNGCPTCECNTPSYTSCLQDSDCPAKQICDTTDYCDTPAGCGDGGPACPSKCDGRCVDAPPPAQCKQDSDCPTKQACVSGQCVATPPPPVQCMTDSDCPANQVCKAGKCVATTPPAQCTKDTDCAAKEICLGNKCVDQCTGASLDANGNCLGPADQPLPATCCTKPPPSQCTDGSTMKPQTDPPSCTAPLQVGIYRGGWACYDPKTCEVQCMTSADCPAGNACQPDPYDPCNVTMACNRLGAMVCQPTSGCMVDADCPPNEQCQAGKCVMIPPPPGQCGDGSVQTCMLPSTFACQSPLVEGPYKGCVACFDPKTCDRQCMSDADCDSGTSCQPDPLDPCNSPGVDCFRAGVSVCQPKTMCEMPPCDLGCPNGYATDPSTGCPFCMCSQTPCNCSDEYSPVCGTDGMTYQNACFAKCAGVGLSSMGACTQTCTVTCNQPNPVCGADGVTYNCGEPDALCHNTTVVSQGPCPKCTVTCTQANWVCGADGVSYECGEPDALCHNTTVAYQGMCQPMCNALCPMGAQVCGSDGKTYDCAALAMCEGVGVAHDGACGTPCELDSDCPQGDTCFRPNPGPRLPPVPAIGECQPVGFCETSYDCSSLPPPAGCVGGSWQCQMNKCAWACGT